MREILFRGKQKEGRWVEGVYFKHDTVKVCFSSDDPKPRHLIIQDGFCDWGFEPPIHCVDVDPKTVGQYTGMIDKNGKKIFEGDIVQDTQSFLFGKVVYATPQDGFDGMAGFMVDDVDDGLQNYNGFWHLVEVLGNIHDDPELLEVTDNV